MNNCPKCNSSDIKSNKSAINGKEACLCKKCKHVWHRERISIKLDADGTPMIELENSNPINGTTFQYFLMPDFFNGVIPFEIKFYYYDDEDKNENNSNE